MGFCGPRPGRNPSRNHPGGRLGGPTLGLPGHARLRPLRRGREPRICPGVPGPAPSESGFGSFRQCRERTMRSRRLGGRQAGRRAVAWRARERPFKRAANGLRPNGVTKSENRPCFLGRARRYSPPSWVAVDVRARRRCHQGHSLVAFVYGRDARSRRSGRPGSVSGRSRRAQAACTRGRRALFFKESYCG